jgi:hypothetical protein
VGLIEPIDGECTGLKNGRYPDKLALRAEDAQAVRGGKSEGPRPERRLGGLPLVAAI